MIHKYAIWSWTILVKKMNYAGIATCVLFLVISTVMINMNGFHLLLLDAVLGNKRLIILDISKSCKTSLLLVSDEN